MGVFRGADAFKKSDSFRDYIDSDLLVKRIIYRYFKAELYGKKAVEKANLPPILSTWLDQSSPDCMFSPLQLKNWPTTHLQDGLWYLECSRGFTPAEEVDQFASIQASGVDVEEVEEFAGLEGEARAKALKRRETSDKKKLERWEEAKKKAISMNIEDLINLQSQRKARRRRQRGRFVAQCLSEALVKAISRPHHPAFL